MSGRYAPSPARQRSAPVIASPSPRPVMSAQAFRAEAIQEQAERVASAAAAGQTTARLQQQQRKTAQSKWMEELQRNKQKIKQLEKERFSGFSSANADIDLVRLAAGLEDAERKSATETEAEWKDMVSQIKKIKTSVFKVRGTLETLRPGAQVIDVESLRTLMDGVETDIFAFKDKQKDMYESLAQEERLLGREIALVEKRIETWQAQAAAPSAAAGSAGPSGPGRPSSTPRSRTPSSRIQNGTPRRVIDEQREAEELDENEEEDGGRGGVNSNTHIPAEVIEMQDFLKATGGTCGGWMEPDHAMFLRLRTQLYSQLDRDAFYARCEASIPGSDVDSIREHDMWYCEYIRLNESKKEAIRRWKERKAMQRDRAIAQLDPDEFPSSSDAGAPPRSASAFARDESMEQAKEERLRALAEWKAKKDAEAKEKADEEARKEEAKRKKEMDERIRALKLKEKVVEYKVKKQQNKEMEEERKREQEIEAQEMARLALTPAEIQAKHERDIQIAMQRKEAAEKRQREAEEREKRIQELAAQVQPAPAAQIGRDFSRLVSKTKVAEMREHETKFGEKDPSAGVSGYIRNVQHRSMPSWRSGQ